MFLDIWLQIPFYDLFRQVCTVMLYNIMMGIVAYELYIYVIRTDQVDDRIQMLATNYVMKGMHIMYYPIKYQLLHVELDSHCVFLFFRNVLINVCCDWSVSGMTFLGWPTRCFLEAMF